MKDKAERIGKARFKLIYAIAQMGIFFLAISIFPSYWVLSILIIMISYLVPFYINSYNIKFLNTETKLSTYFIEDTLFYYLPSIALSLVLELVLRLFKIVAIFDKYLLFTTIFFISFTLLTLFQWLKLFVTNLNMNRMRAKGENEGFEDNNVKNKNNNSEN